MLGTFARLFALRPLLSFAILGVPVVGLVALGIFTLLALKLLFFVVLPVCLVVWLVKKVFKPHDDMASTSTSAS
jgi:type IV secretory pathway VirB3-like protein